MNATKYAKYKALADRLNDYIKKLDEPATDRQITIKCQDGIGYVFRKYEWLGMCGDHSMTIHHARTDDNTHATVEIDDDGLGTIRLFFYTPDPFHNVGIPADSIDTIEYGYRHTTGGYTRYDIYRRDGKTMPASVVY